MWLQEKRGLNIESIASHISLTTMIAHPSGCKNCKSQIEFKYLGAELFHVFGDILHLRHQREMHYF